jgi:hypothetical protein
VRRRTGPEQQPSRNIGHRSTVHHQLHTLGHGVALQVYGELLHGARTRGGPGGRAACGRSWPCGWPVRERGAQLGALGASGCHPVHPLAAVLRQRDDQALSVRNRLTEGEAATALLRPRRRHASPSRQEGLEGLVEHGDPVRYHLHGSAALGIRRPEPGEHAGALFVEQDEPPIVVAKDMSSVVVREPTFSAGLAHVRICARALPTTVVGRAHHPRGVGEIAGQVVRGRWRSTGRQQRPEHGQSHKLWQ